MTDGIRNTPRDRAAQEPDPRALIALLADPSPATGRAVRRALLDRGESVRGLLVEASIGDDPRLRARARQLLHDLDEHASIRRLHAYFEPTDGDLLEGLLLVDDVLGDGIRSTSQAHAVPARIEDYAQRVRDHLGARVRPPSSAEIASALQHVLADQAGFCGPEVDFHHQAHVSLSRTVSDRRGLPLTMCAVYALVARAIGAEAGILPFPGQVLLAIGPEDDRVILDPFHGGEVVDESECAARLSAYGAPPTPLWHKVCTDRQVVLRQVRNLGAAMRRHGRTTLARSVVELADSVSWE